MVVRSHSIYATSSSPSSSSSSSLVVELGHQEVHVAFSFWPLVCTSGINAVFITDHLLELKKKQQPKNQKQKMTGVERDDGETDVNLAYSTSNIIHIIYYDNMLNIGNCTMAWIPSSLK